jgi:hypothetical protein
MKRIKRVFQAVRAGFWAALMPRATQDATTTHADQIPQSILSGAVDQCVRSAKTETDLRFAMRLLWHTHHTLSQIDLMQPDPFAIACTLQFLRLAPEHLAEQWKVVEQEIAERAKIGTGTMEQEGIA